MEEMLRREILRKCKGNIASTEEFNEDDENEKLEDEENFEETRSIFEEELPLQDILAEKRRKYSPEEEFIYLLYNDILKYFIAKWDSHVLRKKHCSKVDEDLFSVEYEDEDSSSTEDKSVDELLRKSLNFEESKKSEDLPSFWKLRLPDEFANITFFNKNSYTGRISRKMMEGEGVYKWNNGVQYKGNFEKNQIEGKGLLEWNNSCWYEGDFKNGYFHGRGIIVDKENDYMYTGEWHMSQRHGKGQSIEELVFCLGSESLWVEFINSFATADKNSRLQLFFLNSALSITAISKRHLDRPYRLLRDMTTHQLKRIAQLGKSK